MFDQNGNLGIKGAQQASAGSYLISDGSGGVSWQSPSFGSLTPQSVSASETELRPGADLRRRAVGAAEREHYWNERRHRHQRHGGSRA